MHICCMFFVFVAELIWITYASPICEESYGYVEVAEDTAVGAVVKEIKCQQSIAGQGTLSYAIKDGNTHGKFGVNTTNDVGKVYVYQSISFESRTINFQLSIEVTENGPIRSTTNYVLDIQITGINDYAPLFLFSPYTVYINEDKQPGSIIFNPIPYDFDKGADGATTSAILDGDDSLFYMDPQTAKIYLRSYLDYERQTQYVLTIQVTDNGIPHRRSSTTLLSINVKDINDNAPVCEESYIAETFDETKEAGSVIKFLKCTDADPGYNGRLSYTITEGDYTKFRLQGPYLVLSKEIDVDTEPSVWSLTVIVRDRGNPRLSALIDIVVYVEGVDDNAPVWAPPENGNYIVNIDEHSPIGKVVVRVSADDLDIDDNDAIVVYYMDDYSTIFTIKPTTGDIFLSQELDHEKGAAYTIPVSAVSHNNPLDRVSTNVIINVIDVNDNTPEFNKDVFQVFVSEALPPKSKVATVTAADKDAGSNGIIQYKIIGGNTDSLFDIQSKTGIISLMGNLDFETKVTHTFYLRASDRGRPSRWSTCTVIVSVLPENEFVPIFNEMETVSIPEDISIGESVFTVEATDNDAGTDGTLSYELEPDEDKFAIESRTGVVRLLIALDRETNEDFEVKIFATDMSASVRKSGSIMVRINILDRNDNAPVCENSFYARNLIPPTASGDVIQTLKCSDADAGGNRKLSYSIVSGNTNSDFSMSADGNLVVMQKPTSPVYRLEIHVTDNGSPSLDTFVLSVINIGGTPEIHNLPTKLFVSEGQSVGFPIFQVKASSVSQQHEYFIRNITSDKMKTAIESPLVKIDKVSGKIYIWHELDREENNHYTIVVGVKEKISGKEAEGTVDLTVLDENDNTPKFENSVYNISMMENIKARTRLISLVAHDQDLNENADLSYAIVGGNEGNSFVIDAKGIIKVRTMVDREKIDAFTLVVTASDNGRNNRLTGSTTVLISVLDADEYIPEFFNVGSELETTLPENTPLAAKVFQMKARDLDVHKELTYGIDDASEDHFIIESHSGEIFLSRLLDREKQDTHILIVTAEGHDRVITATATLSVADINDNDPIFSSKLYKFDVNESSKVGDIVGNINVTDADKGENAFVSLSITKGSMGNAFLLREDKLYVSGNLDYDNFNEYLLEIEAKDNGLPQRTSTTSVIIEVTPAYRIPKFAIDLELIHIAENEHVGNFVYDADGTLDGAREGHGNDLIYSIERGNENGYFSISRNTGEIAIARKLKKLDTNVFILLLKAKNIYKTTLSDEMTLKIEVDDINDNYPTFKKEMYALNVNENTKIGVSIGVVSAVDRDIAQNAFITYKLIQNEDAETFRIDPFVGTLSVKKELNFMYNTRYQLSVIAFDNGSPRLTGSTYVTVNIIDVNDKPPVFESVNSNIRVRENYAVGRTIFQIRAHDGDTGVGGELLYKIVTGNENGTFELDSESGELTLAKVLDRESTETYVFVVEAEDKGTPSLTGTTTLSVAVTDINDNVPFFTETSYEISLDRFSIVETHVLSVSALDFDKGDNALVEYQISQDHDELFQIDGKTGHILTFSDLTEAENNIKLFVTAKDRGIPRLSTSVMVSIEIHPPLVTETEDFSFAVSEYASPNTFVGAVGSSVSSSSRYAIVSGNYRKHFRISEDEGNIFLDDVLDRESYADYYLHVRSTHKLSQNIQTDIYVHISVIDENDNYPQFSETMYNIIVLEHSPIGFSVDTLIATDLDDGSNGKVTYSIMNGEDGDANKLFSLNENGTLVVRSSISYEAVEHLNFTVVAKDNGQYSRQGSSQVNIQVIDIDENVVYGKTMPSKVINLEMPSSANKHYIVGCMTPQMFGLNVSATKVYYTSEKDHNTFVVNRDTGCIALKKSIDIEDGMNFFMWAVAVLMTSERTRGRLALVRVDTFNPNKHVVVLTHSVSKEVLELNRELLLVRLQNMFPSNCPRIWKTEDLLAPVRRKLLFQGSKSYIYVIRNNETDSVSGVQSKKHFILQDGILDVLEGPDGGVAHELTSESFDNFPVVSIHSYKISSEHKIPWVQTTAGKSTLGVTFSVLIVAIIIAVIVYIKTKIKKKATTGGIARTPKPSLSVPPNTNKVDPIYNNLRRASSTADLAPLMNALKILSGMSEEQRNTLIEKTLKSKKKKTDKEEYVNVLQAKFIKNKMKTVPDINVSHIDETLRIQKLSSEEADDKNRQANKAVTGMQATKIPIVSQPITPFTPNADEVVANEQSNDNGTGIQNDASQKNPVIQSRRPKLVSLSVPDDESLSSLDLDSSEVNEIPAAETNVVTSVPERKTENGPIVIGGKEYDGVGKDVTTGKKYLYNTRTGDKIYVTDDILRGAVEHRESIITHNFNNRHDAKISTFKKPPMRRKTSRTRFSTTTIWEMNVDNDPNADEYFSAEDKLVGSSSKSEDDGLVKESSSVRQRRPGVDYTKGAPRQNSKLHSGESESTAVAGISDLPKGENEPEKKDSTTSIESIDLTKATDVQTDLSVSNKKNANCGNNDNVNEIKVKSINEEHSSTGTEAAEHSNAKESDVDNERDDPDTEDASNNNAVKSDLVQKSNFVIPKYKPLNLENVTCKVPKGKSEKKDCLSKDPFYAGWAKMVGRRISTKTVKKKDGYSRTVTIRQGRSLPANIVTQLVQSKVPYKPQRLMTLDIQ